MSSSSPIESLLGPTVLGAKGAEVATSTFKDKYVGIYFSAHWCGPCQMFTPQLAKFYAANAASKNFEIVFVSGDRSAPEFEEYFKSMPWKAVAYGSDVIGKLNAKYKVRGIPSLIWVDPSGETTTTEGVEEVMKDMDGAQFPWKPTPLTELLTDDTPIVDAKGTTTTFAALREANDYVGLYFSAHWCGPCRAFTPQLTSFHRKHAAGKKFEIIFVSSDKSKSEFDGYFGKMPWKALRFEDRELAAGVEKSLGVASLPTLKFLETKELKVICENARPRVTLTPDAFPWPPQPVEALGLKLGSINDTRMAVMFTDKLTDGDNEDAAMAALSPVAQTYFDAREAGKEPEGGDIQFAFGSEEDDASEKVRGFLGLADDEEGDDAVRFVVVDVSHGVKWVWGGTGVPSADDCTAFIASIVGGTAAPVGITAKL